MASPIVQAIKAICEEKGLTYESVMESIEAALAAAYRKDFGEKNQNIVVEFDPESAESKVYDVKEVVEDQELPEEDEDEEGEESKDKDKGSSDSGDSKDSKDKPEKEGKKDKDSKDSKDSGDLKKSNDEKDKDKEDDKKKDEVDEDEEEEKRFNPKTEIMITEAKKIKKTAKLGDIIRTELDIPADYGRMAAQTAKQVITQKLREAEREVLFGEFKEQEGEVVTGVVQRREGRVVLIDLGRATGVMRTEDQVPNERYNPGDRIKIFIRQVSLTTKGPEILVSRTSEELVRVLFMLEIPEIADGIVEIKGISREAGSRSKVAVFTEEDGVDPVGSCIGQRGTRIQTIINELGGEKIDIIEWNEDPSEFIINALSPAKVKSVVVDEEEKSALATVAADQLSLAIGKGGQNVRLAAHLTGWRINVSEDGKEGEDSEDSSDSKEEPEEEVKEAEESERDTDDSGDSKEEPEGEVKEDEGSGDKKEDSPKEKKEKKTKKTKKKKSEDTNTPPTPSQEGSEDDEGESSEIEQEDEEKSSSKKSTKKKKKKEEKEDEQEDETDASDADEAKDEAEEKEESDK